MAPSPSPSASTLARAAARPRPQSSAARGTPTFQSGASGGRAAVRCPLQAPAAAAPAASRVGFRGGGPCSLPWRLPRRRSPVAPGRRAPVPAAVEQGCDARLLARPSRGVRPFPPRGARRGENGSARPISVRRGGENGMLQPDEYETFDLFSAAQVSPMLRVDMMWRCH